MKKFALKSIRKVAYISRKSILKGAHFLDKVEGKATRMMSSAEHLTRDRGRNVTSIDGLMAQHLPQAMSIYPALPKDGRLPAVTLLIPTLSNELIFGGIATALIVAVTIADKKRMNLRVVQTFKYGTASVVDFLKDQGIEFSGDIEVIDVTAKNDNKKVFIDIHPDDIFMASAWADAYVINQLPLQRKFVYLMQDFEPIFYPNGDEKIRSESTYRSNNYVALCNTRLLHDHIESQNYPEFQAAYKTWFEPAVALDKKPSHITNQGKKVLFVYGRPRVKRNLFLAAIEALNTAVQDETFNASQWEICIAGEDGVPDIRLDNGVVVRNLGKMSFGEYYDFVHTVDLAVTPMMAPHPNYPTLEFASVGTRVVTTSYGVKTDLSRYSDNIVIVDPSIDALAGAIRNEVINIQGDSLTKSGAIKLVSTSWSKNLEKPVSDLIKKL